MTQATARAHTNIALIKYWGKQDEQLKLPQNNSLSLTLDHFYTDTTVIFDSSIATDDFQLDGQKLAPQNAIKIQQLIDHVRQLSGQTAHAQVISTNHVPTSAGLASSASGFAALAAAASKAAGLDLTQRDLSRLARRGSGSASRSIFGGFAEWQKGDSDETSYAVPIQETVDWEIAMLTVVVTAKEKKISSSVGMKRSVLTSPYYSAWVANATQDLTQIKQAIASQNFEQVGQISERNAMRMHALTLSSDPSFTYFNADSLKVMQAVNQLRDAGIPCYYTMDAGPNVKIICRPTDAPKITAVLSADFAPDQLILAQPGPGISYLD